MVPNEKFGSEDTPVGVAELVSVMDTRLPMAVVIVVVVCPGKGTTTVSVLVTVAVNPPVVEVDSESDVEGGGSSESRVPGRVTCLRRSLCRAISSGLHGDSR